VKTAEVITILQNRLTSLKAAREAATAAGALDTVAVLDEDIEDTQATIDKLQS
jgi:hypothetical protein